ncbi:hypothetical protein Q7P37_007059 [Cladosporium fusiforme]
MSDLCYNCLNCHLPEPCRSNLVQCEICYAFGHHYIFCQRGVFIRDPGHYYQALCHNCDKWHLPHPCIQLEHRCSECGHYGHLEWFCPVNAHDRVAHMRNERMNQPRTPAPTNHHNANGSPVPIPHQTVNLIKLHGVQEAFNLINQGWGPHDVVNYFALADTRQIMPMPQQLANAPPVDHIIHNVGLAANPNFHHAQGRHGPFHANPDARRAHHHENLAHRQVARVNNPQVVHAPQAMQAPRALPQMGALPSRTHPGIQTSQAMQTPRTLAQMEDIPAEMNPVTQASQESQAPSDFSQMEDVPAEMHPVTQESQAASDSSQMEGIPGETTPATQTGLGVYEDMHRRFDQGDLAQAAKPAVKRTVKPADLTYDAEQAHESVFTNEREPTPDSQHPVQATPEAELTGVIDSIENTPEEETANAGVKMVLGPRCARCLKSHRKCDHRVWVEKKEAPAPLAAPDNAGDVSAGYSADVEKPIKKKKGGAKRRRVA